MAILCCVMTFSPFLLRTVPSTIRISLSYTRKQSTQLIRSLKERTTIIYFSKWDPFRIKCMQKLWWLRSGKNAQKNIKAERTQEINQTRTHPYVMYHLLLLRLLVVVFWRKRKRNYVRSFRLAVLPLPQPTLVVVVICLFGGCGGTSASTTLNI